MFAATTTPQQMINKPPRDHHLRTGRESRFTRWNLGRAFANCLTKSAQKSTKALGRRGCIPDSPFPIWASFTSAGVSVGGKRMMGVIDQTIRWII